MPSAGSLEGHPTADPGDQQGAGRGLLCLGFVASLGLPDSLFSGWGLQAAKAIRSSLLSPGRPARPKLLSMSLSTQGLTSFVLLICSPLRGLSEPPAPPRAVDRLRAPVWLEAGPGGPGVVGRQQGLPPPPGSQRWSATGCQMTVVMSAAGTAACARGRVHGHVPGCTGRSPGPGDSPPRGGRWGRPAWLAVLRARSGKQGHRAITPQRCLLQTQGGEGTCVGLVQMGPSELPRLE